MDAYPRGVCVCVEGGGDVHRGVFVLRVVVLVVPRDEREERLKALPIEVDDGIVMLHDVVMLHCDMSSRPPHSVPVLRLRASLHPATQHSSHPSSPHAETERDVRARQASPLKLCTCHPSHPAASPNPASLLDSVCGVVLALHGLSRNSRQQVCGDWWGFSAWGVYFLVCVCVCVCVCACVLLTAIPVVLSQVVDAVPRLHRVFTGGWRNNKGLQCSGVL